MGFRVSEIPGFFTKSYYDITSTIPITWGCVFSTRDARGEASQASKLLWIMEVFNPGFMRKTPPQDGPGPLPVKKVGLHKSTSRGEITYKPPKYPFIKPLFIGVTVYIISVYNPYHPCMVYLPTCTIFYHQKQPNVSRYTIHGMV